MRGPALRPETGPDLEHNRVDNRIAVKDAQNSIQSSGMNPRPDRSTCVERISVASADYVEEGFELIVRRIRQGGNFQAGTGKRVSDHDRLPTGHRHQAHPAPFGCAS